MLIAPASRGQNVPLGHWENHFNYLSAQHVLQVKDRIFCSTYNGLFSVNPTDQETKTWSKSDGLTDTGVSSMAFNSEDNLLLLAYRSGNLDLLFLNEKSEPESIELWSILNETQGLPSNKDIKQVIFRDDLAYLCTNFGIVVLNPKLRQVEETYRYIGTNGAQAAVSGIAISADSLYAITSQGLLVTSMASTVNRQYFANWKLIITPAATVSVTSRGNTIYAGFLGKGVFQSLNGSWKLVYPSDSKRYSITNSDDRIIITLDNRIVVLDKDDKPTLINDLLFKTLSEAIETSPGTLWAADQKNGLLASTASDFKTTSPAQSDTTISPRKDSVILDLEGLTWARLPTYLGGGILVKNAQNQQRVLSTSIGNGTLPSGVINSISIDQDGYIWFASDKGVGYIIPQDVLGAARVDAILPVYGERRLFSNEKCTAIATEPGNRKWIGTRTGLYLFNSDGTELVQKFTSEDSPLPSSQINALDFDAATGTLYIDTPAGMVSYRSNSTQASENFSAVTIFPNPVRPGYGGDVGIKGLMNDSVVKITELSGRLIYETRSQGGTASWNLNDYTGRRARGGIYMVFIVSGDGTEKLAGKLAVID
ncbi:PorZ beta-propeller-like domain-containing protein [Dyadobacter pollutisoli]|uniref:PorZ N-terminal beta-propeller domain-containing protein n=1 Tax=Dyadobacter pollutisoli TaxID=2910158 RepID=A0A9E8N8F6_9BACT|nr:two-component regulator propeller domain-containing protein [Dyadobacter pollutisoli]WAC11830.1 hypothetical protein ON006_29370 [Dyadobacter pollutisoli]